MSSSSGLTPSRLNANKVGSLIGQFSIGPSVPTFAATVALVPDVPVQQLNGVNTTSATCTVTAGIAYGLLVVICKADASGTVTYTFGTGFKSTGTAAPTAGKTIVVAFIGDGTNYFEFARSASAITG
jgi:hypothetical protein